jgi:alpha-tubulin suppressor-like RCC1 family protein
MPVHGGLRFGAVSAGWTHACGLTMAGAAYCWGDDLFGALGNGDVLGSSLVPVAVSGGLPFTSIEAGYYTTCGIVSGGAAYCWGHNASGQLGTGDFTDASVPRPVGGGLTFESVAPGWDYACGITPAAIAYCWGSDVFGVLGNGAASGDQSLPVRVTGQP